MNTPERLKTVAPGVRVLLAPNPGMMTGPGTNTYLIGEREIAVVDPGPALPVHLEAIRAAAGAGRIRWIWLTHAHPDHASAVQALLATTGAALVAWPTPNPTYEIAGLPAPTVALHDGETLEVDGQRWQAVHAPGHASDHICFFRPVDGVLLTGDVVVGLGTVVIAPPDGNLGDYLASLDKLAALQPRSLLPGHGDAIADAPGKLAEYKAHRLAREAQILTHLIAGCETIDALVAAIYEHIAPEVRPVAAQQVHGHLLKLQTEGRVAQQGDRWRVCT